MVVWAFLPEVSYAVCKQNKWLYVFNLISQMFSGVSCVSGTVLGVGELGVSMIGFCPLH